MENFPQVDLSDITSGNIQLTGISVKVDNKNHENVQLAFNEEKNALGVVISNTTAAIHLNWRYTVNKNIITGTADIFGTISKIGMNLGFETQLKNASLVPKVNIKDFDLAFDMNSFSYNFDCGICSETVINLILASFKGPLLSSVSNEARNVINRVIINSANSIMLENFPVSIPLNVNMSISTATTGPLFVKNDYLGGPIDGTVYLTAQGYKRPSDAPEMTIRDPCPPGEVCLFANKYPFQTTSKSMNQFPLEFASDLFGLNYYIDIDGSKVPFGFDLRDNKLYFSGGATITFPGIFTVIEVQGTSLIDFSFSSGDRTNMVYVNPVIDENSLDLTTLNVSFLGFKISSSIFGSFVNFLVKYLLNRLVFPSIAIPKISAMPLTATTGQTRFNETYALAGISFKFD